MVGYLVHVTIMKIKFNLCFIRACNTNPCNDKLLFHSLIIALKLFLHFLFFTGVYANHNLRLDQINVYGFDYDYTLAHYTAELQILIYDLAKERLVKEVGAMFSIYFLIVLLNS